MANYFKFGDITLNTIDDVKIGSDQVDKVYFGTELLFEFVSGVTFDPSSITAGGSAPYTTPEIELLTGGTMHFTVGGDFRYAEVYWYKNGVMQGGGMPLWVYDGGEMYVSSRTATVAAGDKIKFFIAAEPQPIIVQIRKDDASGTVEFSGSYVIS